MVENENQIDTLKHLNSFVIAIYLVCVQLQCWIVEFGNNYQIYVLTQHSNYSGRFFVPSL